MGALGGLTLAIASWWSGAVPDPYVDHLWPGIALMRDGDGGSPLAATVAIGAMAILVLAWLRLRDVEVSVSWLRVTTALWFGPLVLAAPLYSRDLYSYAAQGLLVAQGLDPYDGGVDRLDSPWVDATSRVWLDTPAPYGPVFLVIARAAATVSGGNLLVAVLLLRLVAVVSVVALAWLVPLLAQRLGTVEPRAATWLAVPAPLVGAHFVAGGHNDALMVALTVAGWLAVCQGRPWRGAVLVGIALAVKLPVVVVVPFVALAAAAPTTSRSLAARVGRAVTSVALALGVFAAICVGSGLGFGALSVTDTAGRTVAWTSIPTAWGIASAAVTTVVTGSGGSAGSVDQVAHVEVARAIGTGVLVLVLLALGLRAAHQALRSGVATDVGREGSGPPEPDSSQRDLLVLLVGSSGYALLAVAFLGPAFHGWYFLWALALLAVSQPGRRRHTELAVVAAVLCFLVMPDGYGVALVTAWIGVPLVVAATGWAAWRGVRAWASATPDRASQR